MNNSRNKKIYRIALCSIMAAMAISLEKIGSINITQSLKFTLYGIPLIVVGITNGPIVGLITGAVTGAVLQLTSPYGINLISIFWALAPIAWGGVAGLLAILFKNMNKYIRYFLIVLIASVMANLTNTLAMFMDVLLINDSYYTASVILTDWVGRIIIMFINVVPYYLISLFASERLKKILETE